MKIAFIFGYSGIGKSTLGRYFEETRGWIHIEADPASQRQINSHPVVPPSDGLWTKNYFDNIKYFLAKNGRCGALIAMASTAVIDQDVAVNLDSVGVKVVCLLAAPDYCFEQFLKREKETGRDLPAHHWMANNFEICKFLTSPMGAGPIIFVNVTNGRERLSLDEIHQSIVSKI